MYPNGTSFETEEQTISFKEQGPITFGTNFYTWNEGVVYTAKVYGNTIPEIVGKVDNYSDAIMLILAKTTYKKYCIKFESLK